MKYLPVMQSKVRPSTPVAHAQIVVLCNTKDKAEMDELIEKALLERGPHLMTEGESLS